MNTQAASAQSPALDARGLSAHRLFGSPAPQDPFQLRCLGVGAALAPHHRRRARHRAPREPQGRGLSRADHHRAADQRLHFVPSMLRVFLDEPEALACRSLRRVFSGGEALSPELVNRFFERIDGAELHNLYGPAEAAIDVTSWPCHPGASVVPIGRPFHNVRAYILDERRAPVPIGVRGELYLGGVPGRPRLPEAPRAHRRALRPRSLHPRARRAPLPHRRSLSLPARAARSSTSAAPISRSSSAASASSSARSRPRSAQIEGGPRRRRDRA
jgi:hypothetical protein